MLILLYFKLIVGSFGFFKSDAIDSQTAAIFITTEKADDFP
jgi:hypothetical protein